MLASFAFAAAIVAGSAQTNTIAFQTTPEFDLRKAPARLIAAGRNTKPSGPHKLLTYRWVAARPSLDFENYLIRRTRIRIPIHHGDLQDIPPG